MNLIDNTQIEQMFLAIATGRQIATYIHFEDKGLATAYASKIVYKKFFELLGGEKHGV